MDFLWLSNRCLRKNLFFFLFQKKKLFLFVFSQKELGTAEDFAERLGRQGREEYGLRVKVADLEDYDGNHHFLFYGIRVAIFVLATYGEGEPTDNAVGFSNYLFQPRKGEHSFSHRLNYAIFGLGNSTYEAYSTFAKDVDQTLSLLSANRICELGLGDDSHDIEDDFREWGQMMWPKVLQFCCPGKTIKRAQSEV